MFYPLNKICEFKKLVVWDEKATRSSESLASTYQIVRNSRWVDIDKYLSPPLLSQTRLELLLP
jgi:hypothetical protein